MDALLKAILQVRTTPGLARANEGLSREISKKARRTVEERFSSERMAEDTYGIYEHVLNGKNCPIGWDP